MPHLLSWDKEKELGFYPVKDTWYDDSYFWASIRNSKSKIADELNKFRVEIVNKYVKGKVLDFGCGCGQFIKYRGNCLGFDICPKSITELRKKKTYLDFWNGGLKEHKIEAVTMFDVLEHIRNPELVLSQIPCRYVFISIPVFRSKEHALKSRHFKPREHYWYFTQKSIRGLMDNNGFALVESRDDEIKIGREDIYTYVFRKKRLKEEGGKCQFCFCSKSDFKPTVGQFYVCFEEVEVFENIVKLKDNENMCFWDNPAFKIVAEKGE